MQFQMTRIVNMLPVIVFLASLAYVIGGACYFRNNKQRGLRLLLAGIFGLIWGALRIFQLTCPLWGDVHWRSLLDHSGTFIGGATVVLVTLAMLGERKRRKPSNKASDATSEPAPGADSSSH